MCWWMLFNRNCVGSKYHHFSQFYSFSAAVFTAALASCLIKTQELITYPLYFLFTKSLKDTLFPMIGSRWEDKLHLHRPPYEYLSKYISRGNPKIPPTDRILMDPGHKARKNPSDNADLGFQAVGPALRIMQLNVEGLSAAKRHIIQSLAEIHHIDVICL